jgi:hypothetical protein
MRLTISSTLWTVLGACALTFVGGCQANRPTPIDELSTHDGLVRVETTAVDAAYKRPDASLARYSKLLLRPVDVQFAKNWNPERNDSALYQMHPPDREKIKRELAAAFADEFKKDLEKGGYPLVDEPGPDVIEMRAAIVNLYITAPDVSMQTPGRTLFYTSN